MFKAIKHIFSCVREYKWYAIFTPLFMIGEVAMECALPFVMSMLTDEIQSVEPNVWPYVLLMVGGAILSLVCGIFGGFFAAKASVGLARNLRLDIYKKIQEFSFENIDHFSTASLVTRLTTDISTIQMAFQMVIRMVFRAPLMMIFSTVMAFITGGSMAWIFVVIAPLVMFGFIILMTLAMPKFRIVFHKYDKLNQSIQENVSAIRVVKSFVREDYENKKFRTASEELRDTSNKAELIVAWNNPIMNLAIHLANMLIFTIGSEIAIRTAETEVVEGKTVIKWGLLSVGQMSALQTYGVQILMSLMFVSMILVMLAMSLESIKRINDVLVEKSTIVSPENPLYEVKDGSITFKNVNFKYSKSAQKNALENINLEINSGDFIGIIGSTGSGKTSLVNLISRLYDVTEGEILVGGKNVKEYDLKTLRDAVSVVLQKNVLFSGTVADNLRWGDLNATVEDMDRACEIAQAKQFIDGYPERYERHIEQGGTNVSGGQKQRLCIARAILKKPKILILDDSTSAVDTKTDRLIRAGLRNDIPDVTKIVIAQRISSIEDATKIIVMDDGKINAIGTHEELLANNTIYQEVYYTQTKKGATE